MINRLAIEGIDGSGKSTVAEALADSLRADGLNVLVRSPFRMANEALGNNVYDLWKQKASYPLAIAAVQGAVERCEAEAIETGADIVIYDRYWMTAMTELFPNTSRMDAWGDKFVPAVLLRTTPYVAIDRLRNDQDAPWSRIGAQMDYTERFEQVAAWYSRHLLGIYRNESDVSIDALIRNIKWDMNITR